MEVQPHVWVLSFLWLIRYGHFLCYLFLSDQSCAMLKTKVLVISYSQSLENNITCYCFRFSWTPLKILQRKRVASSTEEATLKRRYGLFLLLLVFVLFDV